MKEREREMEREQEREGEKRDSHDKCKILKLLSIEVVGKTYGNFFIVTIYGLKMKRIRIYDPQTSGGETARWRDFI